jgi:hypothetical protein
MSGRRDEEQGRCRDLASLVALAVRRGYEQPEVWAARVMNARALRAERRTSLRNRRGRWWLDMPRKES